MRDDANIPSQSAVERLLAARIGHGDSPHTVRALRGDLDELCAFLAQQGMTPETCGGEPLRRWQAQLGARRPGPGHRGPAAVVGTRAVRRSRPPRRARGRSVARARRPAQAQAPAGAGHGRRLQAAARRQLERRRAQPARSRGARAAVRLRPARQRGLRARARRPTTRPPAACASSARAIASASCPSASPLATRSTRGCATDGPASRLPARALLLSVRGRRALAVGRAPCARAPRSHRRNRRALAARAAARLRYTSVGGGRGAARNSGAARPRVCRDHSDLRARCRPTSRARARRPPPPRMMAAETTNRDDRARPPRRAR